MVKNIVRIACVLIAIALLLIAWMFFDFWYLYDFDRPTLYVAGFTFALSLPFAWLAYKWK